jgi:hypothetical protein
MGVFVKLVSIHNQGDPDLPHIIDAGGLLGLLFGPVQGWQKHCRKDCDYGNDHQQFYQREPSSPGV